MKRHAYLILAHNNFIQLGVLLNLIDDERNDIYLHIDSKTDFPLSDRKKLENVVQHSNIYFTKRISVIWGGYSLVSAELELLHSAITSGMEYSYLHIISGQDLPLKNQDEIHKFFEKNGGKEFIHFGSDDYIRNSISRYKYYYYFQEWKGTIKFSVGKLFLRICDFISIKFQKVIRIDRTANTDFKRLFGSENISFGAGSNWCSITMGFAKYIDSKRDLITKTFNHTRNVDECVLQMLIKNSEFSTNLYIGTYDKSYISIMRCIEWGDGKCSHPTVFKSEDYDFLVNCDYLFARKFDEKYDKKIIELISQYVGEPCNESRNIDIP